MTPKDVFHRVADGLDVVARVIAGAGLIGIVVVITLQVLFRYVLDESLAWTEEISRFLFILTSFVAITVAHRRQLHAGYSSLVTKLPVAVRRTVIIGVDVISIAFFVVVGLSSRKLIEVGLDSQAPATGVPMAWIYLVFPLFALLGIVFSLEHILVHLRGDADVLLSADEDRAVAEEAAGAIGVRSDGRSTT
ncbi:TRAP transporter small permease [Mycobacterium sp. 21AC1]|uniref:TRAP transporter small permease n=1 Tax=[Mycobacterium] appelbergii TaxID=2939269 RepID=UPI0029390328|nr:TRAP transporter small permease [Mycobacterium sp. 21AC1]MDV3124224.1 TRAP transporter small permease [Mycobacterium sp. 21AC1]